VVILEGGSPRTERKRERERERERERGDMTAEGVRGERPGGGGDSGQGLRGW